MISKILFIPRAAADILKVLLHKKISFAERCNIAKALGKIKLAGLTKKLNDPFIFFLGSLKINCLYNKHIGFLVKEIFLEKVYEVKNNVEVKTILDFGSNIGLSLVYFKLRFPFAAIEAYEPDKESFKLLQKNISQNNFNNISAYEMAVSNKLGFLFAADVVEKASVNSQFVGDGKDENSKVVAKDIEDILNKNFDIVKMDIEGGEWNLFRKIVDENLITKANHWFVEFHEVEKNKKQFGEILNCFEKNGYEREGIKGVVYFYKNI